MPKKFTFDKTKRLLKNGQFQYVFRKGRSYPAFSMILIVARTRGKTRVGFSVGKKVGNSVRRSRAKRLLRECYRLLANGLRGGFYLVIIARAPLVDQPFEQVRQTMTSLLRKAGCLRENTIDEKDNHRDDSRV